MKPCILRNDDNTIKQVSAPNGKPSKAYEALNNKFGDEQTALRAYANMYTPEFQSWFKDSKVVDENGEPKIVYLDNTNTDPATFVLGENFIEITPMVISSKDPEINEDGSYNIYEVDEIQDVFGGYKQEDYLFFDDELASASSNPVITNSNYANTIIYKSKLLKDYYNRLKKLKNALSILEKNLNVPKNLASFKNLSKYKLQTEGLIDKTRNEIIDLENKKEEGILNEILNRDLERLNYLANRDGITITDYFEAKDIIGFLKSLLPEKGKEHPFYSQEALFDKDSDISEEVIKLFEEMHNSATKAENKIIKLRNNLATSLVNMDASVKSLYEKKLEYKDITFEEEGLKDATWVDKMFYDIATGLFTNNGVITEVMLNTITLNEESELKKANDLHEKLENTIDDVIAELKRLGYSNFFGRSVSYEIFNQKDEFGFSTGNVVTEYSIEYDKEVDYVNRLFDVQFANARAILDITTRKNAFNKAADKKQQWYRENTIQLDIRKIPEIIGDQEFASFQQYFETDKASIDSHVAELKSIMSEKEYQDLVKKQKALLFRYLKERATYSDPSVSTDAEFYTWDQKSNPFIANAYFYDNKTIDHETATPEMAFNVIVPRKNKAAVTTDPKTGNLIFNNTSEELNYYDKNYEVIKNNPALKKFHDAMMEILGSVHEGLPFEYKKKNKINTIKSIDKTLTEAVIESNNPLSIISELAKKLMNKFKSTITGNLVDSIEISKNPQVRADFLNRNQREIGYMIDVVSKQLSANLGIKITNFTKIYSTNGEKKKSIDYFNKQIEFFRNKLKNPNLSDTDKNILKAEIKKNQDSLNNILTYDRIGQNKDALEILTELLGVDPTIDALKNKLNNKDGVLLKDLIESICIDETMRQKSFDLPKVLKNYATLAAKFKSKNDSKLIVDILKDVYKEIKEPVNENDKNKKNAADLIRENAISQLDSWYYRTILGENKYSDLKSGLGTDEKTATKNFVQGIIAVFKGDIRRYKNEREKDIYNRIEKLLEDDKKNNILTNEEVAEFKKIQNSLGKYYSVKLFADLLNTITRALRLGYNLKSMLNNRMEGEQQNLMLVDLGYISKDSYWRAVRIARSSFFKNLSFGLGTKKYNLFPEAVKARNIAGKLQKIQDSKNEVQRSSENSTIGLGALKYANVYEGNTRVEYLNQIQLVISSLMDTKIKDKDGNEFSVWDALNVDGTLKPQFKSGTNGEENIKNWELMKGDNYKSWSTKLGGMINLGHGNYHHLRGMLAKDSFIGQSSMMFKSWLPMNLASKWSAEQESIILGKKVFKGRHRSLTAGAAGVTASLYTIALLGSSFGSLLMVGGMITMMTTAITRMVPKLKRKKNGQLTKANFLPKPKISFFKDIALFSRMAALKSIGFPIKRAFNKDYLLRLAGNYENYIDENFTEEDALNMNANATEVALTLQRLMLLNMLQQVMMGFLEWEDEEDRPFWYNFFVNMLNGANQNVISMFIDNPVMTGLSSAVPTLGTVYDMGRVATNAYNLSTDESLYPNMITDGKNRGDTYFKKSISRLFPGTFKDAFRLSTGDMPEVLEKTYTKNPFETAYQKEWKKQYKADKTLVVEKEKEVRKDFEEFAKEEPGFFYSEDDIKQTAKNRLGLDLDEKYGVEGLKWELTKDPKRFIKKAYREFKYMYSQDNFKKTYPFIKDNKLKKGFLEYLYTDDAASRYRLNSKNPKFTAEEIEFYVTNDKDWEDLPESVTLRDMK